MFQELLLNFISLLHILFVLFVVGVPFLNSNYFLLLHAILVPFVMLHWVLNNNTCALTVLEKKLRQSITGKDDVQDECITCKLIEPVYDFKNNYKTYSAIIYIATTILWLISVSKLVYKYKSGKIKNMTDLFRI